MFYTNVSLIGEKIHVRYVENGTKKQNKIKFAPSYFLPKRNGEFRSLTGEPFAEVPCDSIADYRKKISNMDDLSKEKLSGNPKLEFDFIYRYFEDDIDFDMSLINIAYLDIEVYANDGKFPEPRDANYPINAISMRMNGVTNVFALKFNAKSTYENQREDIKVKLYEHEEILLSEFLEFWKRSEIDIISGWNVSNFDITYICRRIEKLFGSKSLRSLSPYGMVYSYEKKNGYDDVDLIFSIKGLSQMDYLALYKKFTFTNQESYKLDYIANIELGDRKTDVSDYDNLFELYEKDFQLFLDYNIQDTELIEKLDQKMKLMEIGLGLAYFSKVNFEDIFSPMRYWENIIQNYLFEQKIVNPIAKKKNTKSEKFGGAFVFEPIPQRAEQVVSFDFTSLYPSVMMAFNISPECIVDESEISIEEILDRKADLKDDYERDLVVAANGVRFTKEKMGFIPALVARMLDLRKDYKIKMLENKKQIETLKKSGGDPEKIQECQRLVVAFNNKQMVTKVAANSFFGICGLQHFRFYDIRLAEAITFSAQAANRFVERYIKKYLNETFQFEEEKTFTVYGDTDSQYFQLDPIIEKLAKNKTKEEKLELAKKIGYSKLTEKIDQAIGEFNEYLNVYRPELSMKLEAVGSGVFIAKKKYILSLVHFEGVDYTEPQLKMTGVEAVKAAATPNVCRKSLTDCAKIILYQTEDDLIKYVENFRKEWNSFEPHQIAFPKGISDLHKYYNADTEENFHAGVFGTGSLHKKGCPIHVRAAISYNYLIRKHGLVLYYNEIKSGSKMKYVFLRDEKITGENVIGFISKLPKELNLHEIVDYNKQFEKAFLSPLEIMLKPIGWQHEKKKDLFSYF